MQLGGLVLQVKMLHALRFMSSMWELRLVYVGGNLRSGFDFNGVLMTYFGPTLNVITVGKL
jgi:hypothetical protein